VSVHCLGLLTGRPRHVAGVNRRLVEFEHVFDVSAAPRSPFADPRAGDVTSSTPDRRRRASMERRARSIRARGQRAGWPAPRIVDELLRLLPDLLPLEAHRLARGWTRRQVSSGIDRLCALDGKPPLSLPTSVICEWEHGVYLPRRERQEYLARLYQTTPERLIQEQRPRPAAALASVAPLYPVVLLAAGPLDDARRAIVYEPWTLDLKQRDVLVRCLRRLGGRPARPTSPADRRGNRLADAPAGPRRWERHPRRPGPQTSAWWSSPTTWRAGTGAPAGTRSA
jgi:hypothetical protein